MVVTVLQICTKIPAKGWKLDADCTLFEVFFKKFSVISSYTQIFEEKKNYVVLYYFFFRKLKIFQTWYYLELIKIFVVFVLQNL